ncbi:pilus assembly PilX family protein [Roseateles sp. DB2]|uniref:pilus assembly PilX family protein n=1 Tax=Roseateles sp. DB2 TaxID=3453717 RepID=UPI003EE9DD81
MVKSIRNLKSLSLRSRRQRGASMMFALIALAVLTLGAVALVRSVDTGMLTLGNLGFRKDALSAASAGSEAAVTWLFSQPPASLHNNDVENGYYATAVTNLAPMDTTTSDAHPVSLVDWDGNDCGKATTSATRQCLKVAKKELKDGVVVKYVVTRLCSMAGRGGSSRPCVIPLITSDALSMDRGVFTGQGTITVPTAVTFYRVIARTEGARGSVAYTETLVHF